MNDKLSSILTSALFFAILAMMSAQSFSLELKCPCFFDVYAGYDAQIRQMPFKKNFGSNIFKGNRYEGHNIFFGIKYNEYVGIEIGFENSRIKNIHNSYMRPGDYLFGTEINLPHPGFDSVLNLVDAKSKIRGINLSLMGFIPIFNEKYNTQLIGSIGASSFKNKTVCTLTEIGEKSIILNDHYESVQIQRIETTTSYYKRRKTTLRLGTGIQHYTDHHLGLRALITWEKTNRMSIRGVDANSNKLVNEHVKFKDSLIYHIGAFIPF
jgi:hypothetical protein